MNRIDVTEQIVLSRLQHAYSWQELAEAIGKPAVWTTAALLGQHPFNEKDAKTLVELLELDADIVPILMSVPSRAAGTELVPSDPTVYRFYEALQVYGPAIKELIHEQFGDGIMSAINFSLDVQKRSHPSGDRVVVTFDGKFLPYDWVTAEGADEAEAPAKESKAQANKGNPWNLANR